MYYAKEFSPGRWHVVNRDTRQPIYDDAPNGKDKPRVFDEDTAEDVVERLNTDEQPTE